MDEDDEMRVEVHQTAHAGFFVERSEVVHEEEIVLAIQRSIFRVEPDTAVGVLGDVLELGIGHIRGLQAGRIGQGAEDQDDQDDAEGAVHDKTSCVLLIFNISIFFIFCQ